MQIKFLLNSHKICLATKLLSFLYININYPLLFPDSTLTQVEKENPRLLSTAGRPERDTKLSDCPENFCDSPNCPVAGVSVVIDENTESGDQKNS